MYIYDTEDLLSYYNEFRVSEHALREAHKDGIRGRDIVYAIFNGRVVEHYPERKRVLIAGPIRAFDLPLHVVCEYGEEDEIVAVTVYIPDRPNWVTELARGC
jgi:hypothetical protein